MKKFLGFLLPIMLLLFFIFIMLSGNFLKKPFNKKEDVMGYRNETMKDIKREQWEKGEKDIKNMENAWKIVERRIQFSVERDEMYNININIAKAKGAINIKEKSDALMELYEMGENWNELTK